MNTAKEIEKIDKAIEELVYDKAALRVAYDYYHSKRSADQFKHLEENYGIGVPTGVEFHPLVRPHIDRLVGEYLGLNQDLKISCKDEDTLSNILREKQLEISKRVTDKLRKHIENNIIAHILDDNEIVNDPFIEDSIEKIKSDIESSFVSSFEIAAQKILLYIKQSKSIDIKNKVESLILDLCIGGMAYFRTRPSISGDNVRLEVLNPIDTFVERNPNSKYINDSYRAVVRRYMSVTDIINEYGPYLKEEHIQILKNSKSEYNAGGTSSYIQATSNELSGVWNKNHKGILGGLEVHPHFDGTYNNYVNNLYTVYDVEWIEVDYKTGVQTRHEGTKIGSKIYIAYGESDKVVRTKDNPKKCQLRVNGVFFLDKNGEPNSMILKTIDLQNKYDILSFYRDNLIASSGTVGDWIDLAYVPQVLGVELPERLQKWLAYKKQGLGLIDSSQEGGQMMNTIFNGYDDSIRLQSIQAIELAMQSIKQQVSMVTGVLPEALAQYEQRDAVSNVQLGVRTTMLMTKQIFTTMDTLYKEINYDLLNLAKIVWPDGLTGTLVLGNNSEIFTALPKHYTMTDFDVHIEDSTQSYQNVQSLMAISAELIKSGVADLKDVTEIMTATSMSQLKRVIDKSIASKKEENNIAAQLHDQVQKYEQHIKEMNKNINDLQQELERKNAELNSHLQYKYQIEAEKLAIEKEKVKNDKEYNDALLRVKQQQVNAQVMEITDSNSYNDKIKSVV